MAVNATFVCVSDSGDLGSASSPLALSPVSSPMSSSAAASAAARALGVAPPAAASKMEALDVLPPGLIEKLAGPYRCLRACGHYLPPVLDYCPGWSSGGSLACTFDLSTELIARLTMCREEAASVRMLANLLFHSPCALCITDATQVCGVPVAHLLEARTVTMTSAFTMLHAVILTHD